MGKTRDGLTAKQMHFARCVASGMSQSAAYREAFDVAEGSKTATHREAASRLMARADIKARVDGLIAQRERSILASALSDKERVLTSFATGLITPRLVTAIRSGQVNCWAAVWAYSKT